MKSRLRMVALLGGCLAFVPCIGEAGQRVIVRLDGGNTLAVQTDRLLQTERSAPDVRTAGTADALARSFKLTTKSSVNPHLVLTNQEIARWQDKQLPVVQLRRTFAAMKTILDAADEQKVRIRDWEMLAEAVRQLEFDTSRRPDIPALICDADTSEGVIKQAWDALKSNPDKAVVCARVAVEKWTRQADAQQAKRADAKQCDVTPPADERERYFAASWALSDIAAAWFIRGMALAASGDKTGAREAFKVVISQYSCAYIWDPRGWFWRASEGAEEQLRKL
jgi:hypothetical protein